MAKKSVELKMTPLQARVACRAFSLMAKKFPYAKDKKVCALLAERLSDFDQTVTLCVDE